MNGMRNLRVEVKQGRIHVNSVSVLRRGQDFVLLSIDCRAKRYEIAGYCLDNDHGFAGLLLDSNEHTLHTEETEELTLVKLFGMGSDCGQLAETGRYTTTWLVYAWSQRTDATEHIWTDDSIPPDLGKELTE